jgi:hypothetical protein
VRGLLLIVLGLPVLAVEFQLEPEVHSFVSFGYLQTTGNNWLGNSRSGTGEFWEAAANAQVTPLPQTRVAGQLFARDFERYDNGRVQVDWLFAEWQPRDLIGVQVGRVKIPLGLYNEVRDVDVARATIFLPTSIYALRSRDINNSTDGAKVFGFSHIGPGGALEYAAFFGHTDISTSGGFAGYMTDVGFGDIQLIDIDYTYGGMLHWHTPLDGLGVRMTVFEMRGLHVRGTTPSNLTLDASTGSYFKFIPSIIYDHGPLTLAAEAGFNSASADVVLQDANGVQVAPTFVIDDRSAGGYFSGTWHFPKDLDATASVERQWDDPRTLDVPNTTRFALAARWGISAHWSVKAEYQHMIGNGSALRADNPDGLEDHWDLFALKTTLDF